MKNELREEAVQFMNKFNEERQARINRNKLVFHSGNLHLFAACRKQESTTEDGRGCEEDTCKSFHFRSD